MVQQARERHDALSNLEKLWSAQRKTSGSPPEDLDGSTDTMDSLWQSLTTSEVSTSPPSPSSLDYSTDIPLESSSRVGLLNGTQSTSSLHVRIVPKIVLPSERNTSLRTSRNSIAESIMSSSSTNQALEDFDLSSLNQSYERLTNFLHDWESVFPEETYTEAVFPEWHVDYDSTF